MTSQFISTAPPASARSGLTLLEVLIAAGILVVGLSSVAAILPAASALLGEAIVTDRAATLAANAAADIQFRKILKASDFQGGVTTVVMGQAFPTPFYSTSPRKKLATIAPTAIDRQAYGGAWYLFTATPLAASGATVSGMPVRLTVVVTRSADAEQVAMRLIMVSPGVYRVIPTGTGTDPNVALSLTDRLRLEGERKRFLSPCSWVLVNTGNVPTWLRIGSSWATHKIGVDGAVGDVDKSFVSFSDATKADAMAASGALNVRGVAGIVRVEEHIIPLD